jgi:hypothetical protein
MDQWVMTRIVRFMAVAAGFGVLTSSGCAEWHCRKEYRAARRVNETISNDAPQPSSETPQLLWDLQNASMNDWKSGRTGLPF